MGEVVVLSAGGMIADWIGPHLSSVVRQTRKPDRHILWTPDEKALAIARGYLSRHPEHVVDIRPDRGCALANIVPAVHELPPDAVCVFLDADDAFACDDALEVVAEAYEDRDLAMTWGQFRYSPGGGRGFSAPYPREVVEQRTYRHHDWLATHLKTCRAGLFKLVRESDLRDPVTNEWLRECADLAIVWPMLEMMGDRGRYIDRVLYEYQVGNPASVHNVEGEKLEAVRRITARLRAMPVYPRVELRPW